MPSTLPYPVSQIAYFVPDVREAARAHAALFGSGPYYVIESVFDCMYRGQPDTLDHSAAYGQWGEVMIEFIQQNDARPSILHERFAPGSSGLHHVALIVDDLERAIQDFAAEGMAVANRAQVGDFAFVMVDALERHGHFIELYEASPLIRHLYDTVREGARDFDGREPIRPLVF
jgi:hypothetical protein